MQFGGRPYKSQPSRRRCRRELSSETALLKINYDEILCKIADISPWGIGFSLHRDAAVRGDSVDAEVYFGSALRRFRGTVAFSTEVKDGFRIGVMLPTPRLSPVAADLCIGSFGDAGLGNNGFSLKKKIPTRVNLGMHCELSSSADRQSMKLEQLSLARAIAGQGVDLGNGWEMALREFLGRKPEKHFSSLAARELFRLAMVERYPCYPGVSIAGKIRVLGGPSSGRPDLSAAVTLDRFAVAISDSAGNFLAEGIPIPDEPVVLKLGVREPSLRAASVELSLPAGRAVTMIADLAAERSAPSPESASIVKISEDKKNVFYGSAENLL